MADYYASKEHLKSLGLNGRDANRLLRALGTLADYEGVIKKAIREKSGSESDHTSVCHALRYLVDGDG